MRRWAGLLAAGAVLLISAEVALRSVLGPPALTVLHPTIEYIFAPNQDVTRFGNRVRTNAHGMRSGPAAEKAGAYRLAVFGDSVVNGGNLTDQDELATALLDGRSTRDGRPVEVLNISAGSWGPGNLLAYVETYGLFDADYAVIVLSGGDLEDDRTFVAPPSTTHPTERPALAMLEFVDRYVRRYSPVKWSIAEAAPQAEPVKGDARRSLRDLLGRLGAAGLPSSVVLHPERGARAGPLPGDLEQIAALSREAGAAVVDGRRFLGPEGYRDGIHLNAAGQAELADAIASCDGLALR